MTEAELFPIAMGAWAGIAVAVAVLLLFVTAPYGRHVRGGWGPTLPSTAGWILMELPAVLGFLAFFAAGSRTGDPVNLVFVGLWMLHYGQRTFVFPFLRRGGARPMPLSIVGLGMVFNLANAWFQSRWLNTLGPGYELSWLTDPRFLVGAALFLVGFGLNVSSDAILRNLRAPGETGYRIPEGGMFRWVSSPNYLGEILEWIGWAVATWSIPGALFALWTACNLGPRALANHRWYLETFPDYPPDRKALLPGLL